MGVDVPVIREIQDEPAPGDQRKNKREIAAARREAHADRYKLYQEKAEARMKNRNLITLKTKPLSQLKDSLT